MPRSYTTEQDVPYDWDVGDLILNRYEVRGIHEGGMGRVYRVYHREWRTELAVKTPRRAFFENQQQKENFTRECYTWINLGLHPHIVSCYFVRQLGGVPRVFAEYVEGGTLREWIDSRKLYTGGRDEALARIIDIAIQMAWGLHQAHESGVIHQDVKPGNVLMMTSGTARVADFGLAKARAFTLQQPDGGQYRTILSSIGGMTPAYCSPEQAAGRVITRRTDCWSWALSILDMVLGGVSWRTGLDAPAVLAQCRRNSSPRMPKEMVRLLEQCFQLNPGKRPATLEDCAAALIQIYHGLTDRDFQRAKPDSLRLTASALNNKGVSLLELGRFADAENAWEEALKADPHHVEATYNRTLRLWRTARATDDDAVRLLKEIQTSHPHKWQPLCLLAQLHLERGDHLAAKERLREIGERDSNRIEVAEACRHARDQKDEMLCLRVLSGHTGSVNSVCFSADSGTALSGGHDATLRLWDIRTGNCIKVFEGHQEPINAVCLSSDGRLAFSGSGEWQYSASGGFQGKECVIRVWDVATAQCLRLLQGHERPVTALSLSPRGNLLLSGSGDGTLRLWNSKDGRCLWALRAHRGTVNSVAFNADARFAVSGGGLFKPEICLWDVATGKCLRVFKGDKFGVGAVCFSSDGNFLLTGPFGQSIALLKVATGDFVRLLKGHTDFVTSAGFCFDDRAAVSGSWDGSVRLWDVATGRCLRVLEGHTDYVCSVCLSKGNPFALSGSRDGTLRLWKLTLPGYVAPPALSRISFDELEASQSRHAHEITRAQEQIHRAAITEAASTLRRIRSQEEYERDPVALELWQQLCLHLPKKSFRGGWLDNVLKDLPVNSGCVTSDWRYALVSHIQLGGTDNSVRLCDLRTGRCVRVFEGHTGYVHAVCLNSDGCLGISGSSDKTVRLWDVATGRCLREFVAHDGRVTSVCISPDDRFIVSGSSDKTLRLWELATGRCLRTFLGHADSVQSVNVSADGGFILSGSGGNLLNDNTLRLWDVAAGSCIRIFKGHTAYLESVCQSADGCLAFSGSADSTIRVWDCENGLCLRIFNGHTTSVTAICLSADNRYLFSGSCDCTIRVWEIATGRCVRVFEGHTMSVSGLCASTNGRFLLSTGSDNTMRLWMLDWELDNNEPANWDEGARPFLRNFLTLHTPYAAPLPAGDKLTDNGVTMALTRRGNPSWTEDDFKQLLYTLGCAGYGWLQPAGVRRELEKMGSELRPPRS